MRTKRNGLSPASAEGMSVDTQLERRTRWEVRVGAAHWGRDLFQGPRVKWTSSSQILPGCFPYLSSFLKVVCFIYLWRACAVAYEGGQDSHQEPVLLPLGLDLAQQFSGSHLISLALGFWSLSHQALLSCPFISIHQFLYSFCHLEESIAWGVPSFWTLN